MRTASNVPRCVMTSTTRPWSCQCISLGTRIRCPEEERGRKAGLAEERPGDWRPEFVALNPAGTLPVFITDEHGPIVGAYAISEYLGGTAAEPHSRLFRAL